jgi:hypothetical protein
MAMAILTRIRRIRDALAGRYWMYAIGEMLLIVAGILVALQIDGWNRNRGDRKEERAYLERLDIQMSKNEIELSELGPSLQSRMEALNFALSSLDKDPTTIDVRRFHESLGETLSLWVLDIQADVYAELVSTGKLNLITSAELREALARFIATIDTMNKADSISTYAFFQNDYVPFLLEHLNMQDILDGWDADAMKDIHRRKLADPVFFKVEPDHPLKLKLGNNLTYFYAWLVWMEYLREEFLEQTNRIRTLINEEMTPR